MVPDNGKNVIYSNGKHCTEVFACTVQNGLALVEAAVEHLPEITALIPMIAAAREGAGPDVRAESWLAKALQEVLTGSEDSKMSGMRVVLHGGAPRAGEDLRPVVRWSAGLRTRLRLADFWRQAPRRAAMRCVARSGARIEHGRTPRMRDLQAW